MNREQFDRIVRSVAAITGEADVLVIGSQAILGSHRDIDDDVLTRSMDLDVGPLDGSDRNLQEIAGALGIMSLFEQSNEGAYADPVAAEELAVLGPGWRERLIRVEGANLATPSGVQAVAWCLHPNDILVSKYAAGRRKDIEYCEALIALRLPEVSRTQVEAELGEIAKREPDRHPRVEVALASLARAFQRLA